MSDLLGYDSVRNPLFRKKVSQLNRNSVRCVLGITPAFLLIVHMLRGNADVTHTHLWMKSFYLVCSQSRCVSRVSVRTLSM